MMGITCQKLELDYPCTWEYKLIIKNEHIIDEIVKEIIKERKYNINLSNRSKGGKFKSYTLDMLVYSDNDRKEIYKLLGEHKHIKTVL